MKTFEPSGITNANLLDRPGQFGAPPRTGEIVPLDRFADAARGVRPHAGPAVQHAVEGRHADACLASDVLQSEVACRHFPTHWA